METPSVYVRVLCTDCQALYTKALCSYEKIERSSAFSIVLTVHIGSQTIFKTNQHNQYFIQFLWDTMCKYKDRENTGQQKV